MVLAYLMERLKKKNPGRFGPGTFRPVHFGGPPRGFGDLGRRAIYFQGAGSTSNYFRGAGEQAHTYGDLGSTAKK